MRVIVINPEKQQIADFEVEAPVTLEKLREFVGHDHPFAIGGHTKHGDIVWVDDEGLIHGPVFCSLWPSVHPRPLAGVLCVTGDEDREGDLQDAKTPLEEVAAEVVWLDRMKATNVRTEVKDGTLFGMPAVIMNHKVDLEPS